MDWTQNERYWRNLMASGHFWTSGINRHGLEMNDCQRLYRLEHEAPLLSRNIEEADRYRLGDIHVQATKECERAREGLGAGYGWTDSLGYYASQPDFFEEVAGLGRLPDVPEPASRADVRQCLVDRQDWFNKQVEHVELVKEMEARDRGETVEAGPEDMSLERPGEEVGNGSEKDEVDQDVHHVAFSETVPPPEPAGDVAPRDPDISGVIEDLAFEPTQETDRFEQQHEIMASEPDDPELGF